MHSSKTKNPLRKIDRINKYILTIFAITIWIRKVSKPNCPRIWNNSYSFLSFWWLIDSRTKQFKNWWLVEMSAGVFIGWALISNPGKIHFTCVPRILHKKPYTRGRILWTKFNSNTILTKVRKQWKPEQSFNI